MVRCRHGLLLRLSLGLGLGLVRSIVFVKIVRLQAECQALLASLQQLAQSIQFRFNFG